MAAASEQNGVSLSPSSATTVTAAAGSTSRGGDVEGVKTTDTKEEAPAPSYYATQERSLRVIIWHAWCWFAGTFPLSMLETWELALLAVFFGGLTFLIWYSLFFHFPDHVRHIIAKGTYYLYGKLSHPSATAASAASQISNSDTATAVSDGINKAAEAVGKRMAGEL